jgi:hypothetical protein
MVGDIVGVKDGLQVGGKVGKGEGTRVGVKDG